MMSTQKSWLLFCFTLKSCLMVPRRLVYFQTSHPVQKKKKEQTRTKNHVSFTIPSARTTQLFQKLSVYFNLYLIDQTCVRRPSDSMEAKIMETWLSLFSEANHDIVWYWAYHYSEHKQNPDSKEGKGMWVINRRKTESATMPQKIESIFILFIFCSFSYFAKTD